MEQQVKKRMRSAVTSGKVLEKGGLGGLGAKLFHDALPRIRRALATLPCKRTRLLLSSPPFLTEHRT
jgi:hypothetical protein